MDLARLEFEVQAPQDLAPPERHVQAAGGEARRGRRGELAVRRRCGLARAALGHVAAQRDCGEQEPGGQDRAGRGVVEQRRDARDGDDHDDGERDVAPAGDRRGEQLQGEQGGDVGGGGDTERNRDPGTRRGARGARDGQQGGARPGHRHPQRGGELGVVAQRERVVAGGPACAAARSRHRSARTAAPRRSGARAA